MTVSSLVLSVVQVEFSATGRSFIEGSPTECGVPIGEPRKGGPGPIGESGDELL